MKTITTALPLTCALLLSPQLGCGADDATDEAAVEAEVGRRLITVPAAGAVGVAPNAPIQITFDRPVDPATANIEHFRLVPVEETYRATLVTMKLDPTRRVLTVTPLGPLQGRYRVEIRGIATDRSVVNHDFSFTALRNEALFVETFFDGEPFDSTVNTLDDEGRLIKEVATLPGEGVWIRVEYAYDRRGQLPATTINYDAGPDGVLDTADDVPTVWTVRQFDDVGFPTRVVTKDAGPDGKMNSADDTILQADSYRRIADTTWATYWITAPGNDGVWFTPDDDADRVERMELDAAGRYTTQTIYSDRGPDGLWRTADDVVDSVSTTGFSPTAIRGRSLEAGDDLVFGTADDRERRDLTTLNAGGHATASFAFAGPGPDNTWGTPDDPVYSYIGIEPASAFPLLYRWASRPGPDGSWGTADDDVSLVSTNEYASNGATRVSASYNDPGPDGVWQTADDLLWGRSTHHTSL